MNGRLLTKNVLSAARNAVGDKGASLFIFSHRYTLTQQATAQLKKEDPRKRPKHAEIDQVKSATFTCANDFTSK